MAGERLRVEDDEILERAQDLNQAIATYREWGESPLADSLEILGSLNSSFTERIGRMLRSLTETTSDFLENIETVKETATDIVNNLRQVDTEIASGMRGE
jgi:hypothetical protein